MFGFGRSKTNDNDDMASKLNKIHELGQKNREKLKNLTPADMKDPEYWDNLFCRFDRDTMYQAWDYVYMGLREGRISTSDVTPELMERLPENPLWCTEAYQRYPYLTHENVALNSIWEAMMLYGAAKYLRENAYRMVRDIGKIHDDTLFDKETALTGKNFNRDYENTLYSMYCDMCKALSATMWGFIFAWADNTTEQYARDPRVQDSFGFARVMLRGHVNETLKGLRDMIDQADMPEWARDNTRGTYNFFQNIQAHLGEPTTPDQEAAMHERYFPHLAPTN